MIIMFSRAFYQLQFFPLDEWFAINEGTQSLAILFWELLSFAIK